MMGTPAFLVGMTIFCAVWLTWNSIMPESAQFDPRALNFTLLTLILSLQASYAAPLLLLAQNRQDDRDRVQVEQDRRVQRPQPRHHRLHHAGDRLTAGSPLNNVATRDFVRGELRDLLEDLEGPPNPPPPPMTCARSSVMRSNRAGPARDRRRHQLVEGAAPPQ